MTDRLAKGRGFLGSLNDKCPNPRCNKRQWNHTTKEAKECLQIASADA
jgi:hypothetical protein